MFYRKRINEVIRAVNKMWDSVEFLKGKHNDLAAEFNSLKDEIATNGVVRDLHKLMKENEELRERLDKLDNNGVATAINKLNAEVFKTEKNKTSTGWDGFYHLYYKTEKEATLAGKVNAIIAHLGLDVEVKPQEVKAATVVAKKVKVTKKGRK